MSIFKRFAASAIACCLFGLSCVSNQQPSVQASAVDEKVMEAAEIAINAVNDIRVAHGLQELATTPLLIELTEVRASELPVNFDHVRPDGSSAFTLLKSSGFTYLGAAENIAAGRPNATSTVEQWMESPKHKKNILNEAHTHVGVAYYYNPDTEYSYYWSMYLLSVYDGKTPYIYDDQYIPSRSLGDVNGTYSINSADAAMILDYAATTASGKKYPVVHDFKSAADINQDGAINSVDASIILTYSVNKASGNDCELKDFIW